MKEKTESMKASPFEPAYQLAFPWRGGEVGGRGQKRNETRDGEKEGENETRSRKGVENCNKDEWSESKKRGEIGIKA